jgi:hypothetical protein
MTWCARRRINFAGFRAGRALRPNCRCVSPPSCHSLIRRNRMRRSAHTPSREQHSGGAAYVTSPSRGTPATRRRPRLTGALSGLFACLDLMCVSDILSDHQQVACVPHRTRNRPITKSCRKISCLQRFNAGSAASARGFSRRRRIRYAAGQLGHSDHSEGWIATPACNKLCGAAREPLALTEETPCN